MFQQPHWIFLELHERLHTLQCIAKDELGPIERPEQITDHRKPTALDVLKQNRRAAVVTDSPMNLRRFQIRADFFLQPNHMAVFFEVSKTFLESSVAHGILTT